jgi:group I intron endonuclease
MQTLAPSQEDTTKETEKKCSTDKCDVTGIYGLRNKINGKWYVGHSRRIYRRWHRAYKKLDCKPQRKLYAALLNYGYENFDKVILEECEKELLLKREVYWIKHYNAVDDGYNCKVGGHAPSEKTIEKMRSAKLGTKLTDSHKRNISAGYTKRSSETWKSIKEKQQDYLFMKNHPELWTEEFRQKIIREGLRRLAKQK